jgi:outer membrane protein assembly factor BamB
MRRRGSAVALMVIASVGLGVAIGPSQALSAPSNSDWSAYLNGPAHDSYDASATAITTTNITNLQPVWRWLVPASTNGGNTKLWASPTVYDGVVYLGSEDGTFYAVDESNQEILWSKYLGYRPALTCGRGGIISTATVARDPSSGTQTVYVFGPDGKLYALDADTGAVVWQSVVDTPSATESDYYSWSSPTVANGAVYIGISSGCDHPLVPAGVAAFNQATGAEQGVWHSEAENAPGASVWSSVGVLPNGDVVATTGNSNRRTGTQEPWGEAVVELNGSTLAFEQGWQVPTAEAIFDSDFGASPTQFTATINGKGTPMLGVCNKNGNYYAFEQSDLTAGPLWQNQIVAPHSDDNPGECDAAAIWDGTNLIEGGGNTTTIDGVAYNGSVQSLDPATGVARWKTGLPGAVIGSPTEDGAGVVAAQVFYSYTNQNGVYFLNAGTGAIIGSIIIPKAALFGQPVFDGDELLLGGMSNFGLTAYEVPKLGPAITVSPDSVNQHSHEVLTIKGIGFTGTPSVVFSDPGVKVDSVTVESSELLMVKVTARASAPVGSYNVSVLEPGSPYSADNCTACLAVNPSS